VKPIKVRGLPMTVRDVISVVVTVMMCLGLMVLLGVIAKAFGLGDEQSRWFDIAAVCVVLLGFALSRR
jgi:hypothetical protein